MARRPPVSEMRQHIVTLWGGEDEFIEWCARPSKAWAWHAGGVGIIRIPPINLASTPRLAVRQERPNHSALSAATATCYH